MTDARMLKLLDDKNATIRELKRELATAQTMLASERHLFGVLREDFWRISHALTRTQNEVDQLRRELSSDRAGHHGYD